MLLKQCVDEEWVARDFVRVKMLQKIQQVRLFRQTVVGRESFVLLVAIGQTVVKVVEDVFLAEKLHIAHRIRVIFWKEKGD